MSCQHSMLVSLSFSLLPLRGLKRGREEFSGGKPSKRERQHEFSRTEKLLFKQHCAISLLWGEDAGWLFLNCRNRHRQEWRVKNKTSTVSCCCTLSYVCSCAYTSVCKCVYLHLRQAVTTRVTRVSQRLTASWRTPHRVQVEEWFAFPDANDVLQITRWVRQVGEEKNVGKEFE